MAGHNFVCEADGTRHVDSKGQLRAQTEQEVHRDERSPKAPTDRRCHPH